MENLAGFGRDVLSNLAAQLIWVCLAGVSVLIWQFVRARAKFRGGGGFTPEPALSHTTATILASPLIVLLTLAYGLGTTLVTGTFATGIFNAIVKTKQTDAISPIATIACVALAAAVIGFRTYRSERPVARAARFLLDGLLFAFLNVVLFLLIGLFAVGTSGFASSTHREGAASIVGVLLILVWIIAFHVGVYRIYFCRGLLMARKTR